MLPTTDNDLLRRYLRGDINAAQEAELERRAAADPALAEAMEGLQALPEHDHAANVRAMMAKAGRAETRPIMQANTSRRLPKYWWAAAAGFLLILATVFLLPLGFNDSAPEVAMTVDAVETIAAPVPAPVPEAELEAEVAEEDVAVTEQVSPPPPPPPPTQALARTTQPAPQNTAEEFLEEVAFEADDLVVSDEAPRAPLAAPKPTDTGAAAGAGDVPEPQGRREMASSKARLPAPERVTASNGLSRNQPRYLSGRVTDGDGNPVPNALVRQPGLPLGETTDSNGVFRLTFDATTTSLIIDAEGFAEERIDLKPNGEDLQITLDPIVPLTAADFESGAVAHIDVDAITGGRLLKEPPGYARPAEGFRDLRRRMEASRPPDLPKGKVRVNFLVNPDGSLTDFTFRKRTDEATRAYVREFLVGRSEWAVLRGEEAVRVHFKLVFR